MIDLISVLTQFDVPFALALVVWFTWTAHKREERLAKRILQLENRQVETLATALTNSTKQMERNNVLLTRIDSHFDRMLPTGN